MTVPHTAIAAAIAAAIALSPAADAAELRPHPEHITAAADNAIRGGLAYLARTQRSDGSWHARSSNAQYPVVMTSMAGLALMAGGSTPSGGPDADAVARATDYILRNTRSSGLITSPLESARSMYGHGFAVLYLAQAYGMDTNPLRQKRIAETLQRGVALIVNAQSKEGGWYYTPESPHDEGSVTVTQIQALRACRNAGIHVPRRTIVRACEYIRKCANDDGGISYSLRSRGRSLPAITAAAVATMYNSGEYENPVAIGALDFSRKRWQAQPDIAKAFQGHTYYSLLYLGQAMWFSGGDDWNTFFPKTRDWLIARRNDDGSWQGDSAGPVYGTSIALLTLQLPHRRLPILQR